MMLKKMTDRQLTILYFELNRHYKTCLTDNPELSSNDLYTALFTQVYASLHQKDGFLRELSPAEQQKAYRVLNTFFDATPHVRRHEPRSSGLFEAFSQGATRPPAVYVGSRAPYGRDDVFFTWYMLNATRPRPYPVYVNTPSSRDEPTPARSSNTTDKKESSTAALLLLLALATAAAASSVLATYYVLNDMLQSAERIYHHEGWMQASITLFSTVVSGALSALLANLFLASPLTSLALAAGLSSSGGVVVFGMMSVTVVGAALGGLATQYIQNYALSKGHQDALDPADPYRFRLTDEECVRLEHLNIDPIKVKCALVALRAEIGDGLVPGPLNRLFSSRTIQPHLTTIRQLRRGELAAVVVGDMHFDCRDYSERPTFAPAI